MKISIKNKIVGIIMLPAMILGLSAFSPVAQLAGAAPDCGTDMTLSNGVCQSQGEGQATKLFGDGGMFTTIVNIMLYLIGAISVIMLIFGGIRYTISGGKAESVTNAKNTIMYAIIGIVVAILAYAIVNFVLTSLVAS